MSTHIITQNYPLFVLVVAEDGKGKLTTAHLLSRVIGWSVDTANLSSRAAVPLTAEYGWLDRQDNRCLIYGETPADAIREAMTVCVENDSGNRAAILSAFEYVCGRYVVNAFTTLDKIERGAK